MLPPPFVLYTCGFIIYWGIGFFVWGSTFPSAGFWVNKKNKYVAMWVNLNMPFAIYFTSLLWPIHLILLYFFEMIG